MSTSRRGARPPDGLQNEDSLLDGVNKQLLAILSQDARISTSELARQVGMSAPAVRDRVSRLERAGVIRGYHADIDPSAIGLPVAAWVRVRPGPGQLPKITDLARRSSQISECHRVTGEDCFLMKAHAPSIEALESVLDGFLIYGQTTTAIVVTSPVEPRTPSQRNPD